MSDLGLRLRTARAVDAERDRAELERRATRRHHIANSATMAVSMLRDEHWLEALQYQCRAVAAGLGLTCSAVVGDVHRAIRLTAEYVARQAMVPAFGDDADVVAERQQYARPRDVLELVELWQAVSDAHFEPSVEELEHKVLCGLALHWAAELRASPRDRAVRDNARRTIAALDVAVRRLDGVTP